MYYDQQHNRIKIRLPGEGKQTTTAEKKAAMACMEHEIEGAEVVEWWTVMALFGRRFLKKRNGGQLDNVFGPLGSNGIALSQGVFGSVLHEIGITFFSTGNADVNALRTVQDTLAAEHMAELGIPKDSVIKKELARQQRTSEDNVDNAYYLRIVDPITRLRHKYAEGDHSFKGGIRAMLAGRRALLEGGSSNSSTASDTDVSSGGGGDLDAEVDTVMTEVESELAGEIKVERMKFELKEWKRKNATADGGSTPATVAPAPTGAAPVAAAAAEEKPKKIKRGQILGKSVKYEPKPGKPINSDERVGLELVVEAIKGAWELAKEKQSAKSKEGKVDPVYHYMSLPSNRNAKLPMVWTLQEMLGDEFQPGNWFRGLRCSQRNRSQTTFNKTVDRAEAQVAGFRWLSWQQVDG
ncbi:unnamed protein product [Ectocarpus sp. 12 AP-2014]